MDTLFRGFIAGCAIALALCAQGWAQWSIGAAGTRAAPAGENRYVYLVMSDPLPGKEFEFNDGYQNMHMGDLVQLPGWVGAQRFRLVPEVMPRNMQALYRRGYLILWDQEGADLAMLQNESRTAIAGGKSRLIPGFDYSPDGPVSTTYEVMDPRVTRPDGRKPFLPAFADHATPRPNRYALLEFVDPATGVGKSAFEAALRRHIADVLALPGWMAAQPFRLAKPPQGGTVPRLPFPAYMVIWETEGRNAQDLQDARMAATESHKVTPLPADPATRQSSWWLPISPYITKDDFER